ncbi:putative carrier protein [Trypanosoma vivax]|uniref:Putative mitochondrial carrier protein n=1 Tax=Trypanosoma vivax (strain Y486) TaxID=1055687 RepID=G0U8M0_TRYVY|nr:putative carrier protein [Trypanosoma vivax]CCC53946.1 putative mitochondrial carrier protein [Trypanosoma vivax Y486]
MHEWMLTFLPGAAQGIATVALGHPLDTSKTRMQAFGPGANRSALQTMRNMIREEGLRSLYRGMVPPLLMSATKRSVQFALWDAIRRKDGASALHTSTLYSSSMDAVSLLWQLRQWVGASPFFSGALAGAAGTIIGCPAHVVKIRTQYYTSIQTRNAWTCMVDIFRTEGIRGYFTGFGFHLAKDTCFAGCYLGLYDVGKKWLGALPDLPAASVNNPPQQLPGKLAFLAGSLASMVTWALLYPLDTIKTILQARKVTVAESLRILRRDSFLLYRGLGVSLMKAGPVNGLTMVVYETVKRRTDNTRERHRARQYLVGGGTIGGSR